MTHMGTTQKDYRKMVWPSIPETLLMRPDECIKCQAPRGSLFVVYIGEYNDGRDLEWGCAICGNRMLPNIQGEWITIYTKGENTHGREPAPKTS